MFLAAKEEEREAARIPLTTADEAVLEASESPDSDALYLACCARQVALNAVFRVDEMVLAAKGANNAIRTMMSWCVLHDKYGK